MPSRRAITLIGAALVLLFGTALPAAADGPRPPAGKAAPIIGGYFVTDAPWAASIYRSGTFTCSGTIVAPTWVLTAAHCVGSGLTVRVGSVYQSRATTINVSDYQVAPKGDLALVHLASAHDTAYSQLADADPPVDSTNQICGWGRTSTNGPFSDQLKCADVRVTSTKCYDHRYGPAICTTKINGAAWSGDSGGPQRYNDKQVAVASTADGRSEQTYGSVAASRAWIRTVAGV
ncbi:S1 family peptidase [Actinomadura rubrisoli]|uniref:Trypsin-like serine protease n=1 Tax=Actinomadura rubrisoli TaxID=2530368 RepID=A0A4R5C2R5_9ACTN|nr:trypsin-like serine protease [Actinomadura rubrisoli]TDD93931.1 trypsin-like serine protease [Actinomadura rubrisoli]